MNANYSERLLIEIAHLRHLQSIGVENERITRCLEMLRWIRIEEEEIDLKREIKQEDEWIRLNGNDYIEQLRIRKINKKEE